MRIRFVVVRDEGDEFLIPIRRIFAKRPKGVHIFTAEANRISRSVKRKDA